MATPAWKPGELYLPGSLVVPRTALPNVPVVLQNPGWETGDTTGWDVDLTVTGSGFTGVRNKDPHDGAFIYALDGTSGAFNASVTALNQEQPTCAEGTLITAKMWVRRSGGAGKSSSARVILRWYDSMGAEISTSEGALQTQSERWIHAQCSDTAPAGTASVRAGFWADAQGDGDIRCDTLTWDYDSAAPPQGLMYKAVQPKTGTSDDVEPVWPTVLGVQVIDNDVIWEAVSISRLVWQARPILRSGATEPAWPTTAGERVADNTIAWETTSRRVEDENCPNTKVVIIMASKVFADDVDIIRFSATANPLDWTTEQDAGYLPSGLQSANANDMAVLQQYRGNLVAFNASSFQNWQVDPDPAAMAILDQMEGIGSTWNKAAQPVANELLFLSQRGVRSVGIAAGAENLAAGDVGEPIDVLVQNAVRVAIANGTAFRSTYYPGAGQYWLAVSDYPPAELSIAGDLQDTGTGMPVSYQYAASGGVKPYVFSILSGSLPAGLSMDESGLVTGTPTTVGVYTWIVRVTDADGDTAELPDTAEIMQSPTITGDAPDASNGDTYSYPYTLADGTPPYIVTLRSGSLPSGLSISPEGEITGVVSESGQFTYTVRNTDATGLWAELTDTIDIALLSIAYGETVASVWRAVRSVTGEDWSAAPINGPDGPGSGAYYLHFVNPDRFIACQNNQARYSNDSGATWNTPTGYFTGGGGSTDPASVGDVVIVPRGSGGFSISADGGLSYTTVVPGFNPFTLSAIPGVAVCVVNTGTILELYYSVDSGANWTAGYSDSLAEGTTTATCPASDGERMVFAGRIINSFETDAGPAVFITSDGISVTTAQLALSASDVASSVAVGDLPDGKKRWVVGTNGGNVYYSDDNFVTSQKSPETLGGPINILAWNGRVFMAVGGSSGAAFIKTSADGLTWADRPCDLNYRIYDIAVRPAA